MLRIILFVCFGIFVIKQAFNLLPKYVPPVVNSKNPYAHIKSKDLILKIMFNLKSEKIPTNEKLQKAKYLEQRLEELRGTQKLK
jgi:hypothetical protein